MWLKSNVFFYLCSFLLFSGCSQEEPENILPIVYTLDAPTYFGEPITHTENTLTPDGIALGKKLFFDPLLSKSQTISCASCHQQQHAFADKSSPSIGSSSKALERNSPTLFNLAWHKNFFWDGGANNLESQTIGPITHPDEMGMTLEELIHRLKNHAEYPTLFQKAFQDTIKSKYILYAIAQFEKTLISKNTSYDLHLKNQYTYTNEELLGKTLFEKNCESCHQYPHFSDFDFHNNGLDTAFNFTDLEDLKWGRYRITFSESDKGKYKTPSLRNITISAPYMHDGRFESLNEVLEHYSKGIKNSPYTDTRLPERGFQFTATEKQAIVAYLKSLTDNNYINNTDFQ